MEIKNKKLNRNKNKNFNFKLNGNLNFSLSRNFSKSKSKEKSFIKNSDEKNKILKKERSFNKNYHFKKKSKPKILFDDEDIVKEKQKSIDKINQKKFVNNINVLIFNYQQNNSSIGKNFHRRNFSLFLPVGTHPFQAATRCLHRQTPHL